MTPKGRILSRMRGHVFDIAARIEFPSVAIAALCDSHNVKELAVFGSVLRDDFGPASDVDFLVRFIDDDAGPWLRDLTGLQKDLSQLLGRSVDVIDWTAMERSRNPFRRNSVLSTNRLLYAA